MADSGSPRAQGQDWKPLASRLEATGSPAHADPRGAVVYEQEIVGLDASEPCAACQCPARAGSIRHARRPLARCRLRGQTSETAFLLQSVPQKKRLPRTLTRRGSSLPPHSAGCHATCSFSSPDAAPSVSLAAAGPRQAPSPWQCLSLRFEAARQSLVFRDAVLGLEPREH
eukprot:1338335-Rhodomonas_salina.1